MQVHFIFSKIFAFIYLLTETIASEKNTAATYFVDPNFLSFSSGSFTLYVTGKLFGYQNKNDLLLKFTSVQLVIITDHKVCIVITIHNDAASNL